jgi:ribonuclease BN (tRNA processing enzyme)
MNTSIYIELGSGDTFIFDMGEGAVANYLGAGVAINQLNDIFLSHLHV